MINKIFGYFKSSNTSVTQDLANIKLIGSFYKKVIGSKIEEMSDECTLTLALINENTFDYNLNVFNEEYQFSNTWETISFALTNDRGFKYCTEKGKEVLIWEFNRDFYIFSLFTDEINKKNKIDFFKTLVTLISSYEYAESISQASVKKDNDSYLTQLDEIEDINQFLEENYGQIYGEFKNDVNVSEISLVQDLEKLKFEEPNSHSYKSSLTKEKSTFQTNGILHKYDKDIDDLIVISDKSTLGVYQVDTFKYYLAVLEIDSDKIHTATGISQEMNLMINRDENLIMWLSKEEKTKSEKTAYNFVFYEESKADLLRKVIAKTQYESSTMNKYENLAKEDQNWLENENVQDDNASLGGADVEMEIENEYQESSSEITNKATAQAYLHDRTFVIRDDNTIGVYKTDEEDVLTHLANLPAVLNYGDKTLNIKNAQMFYSDTNMILLDNNNQGSAFRYDLGKGKIIDEWSADSMKKIEAITLENKYGQMTDSQLVTAVNSNNLFVMDPRVNKNNKVVATKSYKTNPKMNCLITTETGGIATGSLNGEIRMYSEVGKNAKNLLPCFGDPIRAIDATADGKYLLATCDKYLIVIPTSCKTDKNGFSAQMGKEKPNPKTLKVKPIDVNKYNLEKLQFTHARFNVNKIDGEANIITSMGDFVIIWNFTKVKKGILDDYKIKKVNQNVIENQFKFNRNQIVVTMENKLRIQNQKKLFP